MPFRALAAYLAPPSDSLMEGPTTWDVSDPSEAQADHIPVKKLSIGSWNLLAKYDEHVLLSFYWAERKPRVGGAPPGGGAQNGGRL